jgi:outer membrane protein OmpA-like peptidoglycan-associated protein
MKLKTPLFLVTAGALALSGCTDTAVATNDPNQRTKEGAVVGGLLGALAGVAVGDDAEERRRGALIGGLVGAGVGAAVGNNLDKQAAELQAQFQNDRIQIINNGNSLVVRMPQDILFATDSAAVNPGLQGDLRVLANSLQRYPGTTVQVVGHTDNTGSASYNQDLSVRRANSVASVLIGAGVSGTRIAAFGRGESAPIADNLTAQGRAQNRRVDITIIPNG